jgi:hypothetical protein
MSGFSRSWLRLREPADLAARDPGLARRFAAALPRKSGTAIRLVDLGAGSGANCRALMPRIAGDQEWILIDRDRALIAAQEEEFTLWARRQGYPILAGGGRITLTAGSARWSVTGMPLDLAREAAALAALHADGMTTAAVIDLVSARWIDGLAGDLVRRHLPFLAVLTVDGARDWAPPVAEDAIVGQAFRAHQIGDKGFGPALGGAAPAYLADALMKRGARVEQAPSPWRLDARQKPLLATLLADEAHVAREMAPNQGSEIALWEKQRREQLENGILSLTVGHCDLLALPA